MEINIRKEGNVTVIGLTGRLDVGSSADLEKQCGNCINNGDRKLLLDLAGVEYVSSAGLRCVLAVAKKLKPVQGTIALCNLSSFVQEVFVLAGFDNFLPVYASLEEGLEKS